MKRRAFITGEMEPVRSVFGRTLNMRWLVDAIELAIRERSAWPIRMWLHLSTDGGDAESKGG